jgi:protein-S-isoprenylcysteine O-methyltransferase Ste14
MGTLYIVSYFIWLGFEVTLSRLFRTKATDLQHADAHSLPIIWFTLLPVVLLAVYIVGRFPMPMFPDSGYRVWGLVVLYIGLVLRVLAVRELGALFTVQVTIRQGHKLKTDGLYRYLRHPNYFAVLICFTGFGITLNNWISLALVVLVVIAVFILRIRIEERILVEQFGDEYLDYKKRTSGFIPGVY